jgi:hypothetical protein
MDTQVDAYIERQSSPQKEILQELRAIFREAIPDCKEEMRWGVITYASGKFYIAAMKTRVHVGFAIAGLKNDEVALFEGTGKTMRHVKISTLETIDKPNLFNLIKLVSEKATCKPC